ncbi:hypothetical protein HAX54_019464, partial [Datura stramonium]|nr:hypothetical protein [Datura stramonium]
MKMERTVKCSTNLVSLSSISFLERSSIVYRDRHSIVHRNAKFTWRTKMTSLENFKNGYGKAAISGDLK